MARLSPEMWERMRVEYESGHISQKKLAIKYKVDRAAISRKAREKNWDKSKYHPIVQRTMDVICELEELEKEKENLPLVDQWGIEKVIAEQLKTSGNLAKFDNFLILKGLELAMDCETPTQWLMLTQGRKNLAPAQAPLPLQKEASQTTVNVQSGVAIKVPEPQAIESYRKALAGEFEGDFDVTDFE